MRIAMLGHKRIPSREGGVEIVVTELAARMAAMGHEVTCYNRSGHHVSGKEFDGKKMAEYKGVHLKYVPTINGKGLAAVSSSFFAALAGALRKYDVVHIHAEGPAAMCWLPKLFGKRVVVTVHGLDWKREKWARGFGTRYIHFGERCMVRYADRIIVLNEDTKKYFQVTYGCETTVIPNGVERPVRRDAGLIREKYGLSSPYLLALSRLVPEKRTDLLIEAFSRLGPQYRLIIAGEPYGPFEKYQKLIDSCPDPSRVHVFPKYISDSEVKTYFSAYEQKTIKEKLKAIVASPEGKLVGELVAHVEGMIDIAAAMVVICS